MPLVRALGARMMAAFRHVIHWRRSWGSDDSVCGRVGVFSEAVINQDLVTCRNCRRIFRAEQDRAVMAKIAITDFKERIAAVLNDDLARNGRITPYGIEMIVAEADFYANRRAAR